MESENLAELIEWSDGTEECLGRLKAKLTAYEEIVIFGAGIGGRETLELLQRMGVGGKVRAFSDNSNNKINTDYMGLPVIKPERIRNDFKNFLVLISSTAFDVIQKQLTELGIDSSDIFYFQPAGISLDKNQDMGFIKENISKLNTVYGKLEDYKSKLIYRNLLNYRITKKESYLIQLKDYIDSEANQYFDKELLEDYLFNDDFVDAGAYTGDTMESFFKDCPQWLNWGKGVYFCFEAGDYSYEKLCTKVKLIENNKIELFNYAVWDKEGVLKFDTDSFGNGEGSRVSTQGNPIKCCSLDKVLLHRTISFIKMDIEGAETRALTGAREIIRRDKPVLTVCIYHKPEDVFEIPLLIEDIIKDEYRFYVRQYRYGLSETVLYAMPECRRTHNGQSFTL